MRENYFEKETVQELPERGFLLAEKIKKILAKILRKRTRELTFLEVAGVTLREKEEILSGLKKEKEEAKECFLFERKKTKDEIRLIKYLNKYLKEFVKKYNQKIVEIPPERIHFLTKESFLERDKITKKRARGAFLPTSQEILVFAPERIDKLDLAQSIIHEMIHFNSFGSLERREGKVRIRRLGLAIKTKKDKRPYFFLSLNEALTTELVKRFVNEYFPKIPNLRNDFKKIRKALSQIELWGRFEGEIKELKDEIAWIDLAKIEERRGEILEKGEPLIKIYSYWRERKALKRIIQIIYWKNRERFNSEEDVFTLFAKAYFSGRLLELARIIEKTFGKGSFRKIASRF